MISADYSPFEYFAKGFKEEIDSIKTQVVALSLRRLDKNIESKIYLDKDQLKLLDFLDQAGRIAIKDAVGILSSPKRTVQLKLNQLKKLGIIVQVGRGPSSAYILTALAKILPIGYNKTVLLKYGNKSSFSEEVILKTIICKVPSKLLRKKDLDSLLAKAK